MFFSILPHVTSRVSHRFLGNHPHGTAAIHTCVVRKFRILDHADTCVPRVLLREITDERDTVSSGGVTMPAHKQLGRSGFTGDRHQFRLRLATPFLRRRSAQMLIPNDVMQRPFDVAQRAVGANRRLDCLRPETLLYLAVLLDSGH